MKDLLNYVIHQLDKLDEKLDSVDKTMVKQEENLREHMRRTEILEEQHSVLRTEAQKQHDTVRSEMHDELEPIKAHVQQVKGVSKFLAAALPILGAIAGAVYKYLM